MNEKEVWKPIEGYEGYYEVSNLGRVQGLDRTVQQGMRRLAVAQRVLKPWIKDQKYLFVTLCHDGPSIRARVHQLVAAAFLGLRPDGLQINHLDGNKKNNHVGNLEYVTPSENIRHAVNVLGTIRRYPVRRGEDSYSAKLSKDDVLVIRSRYLAGNVTQCQLAQEFGVGQNAISSVVNNRTWKHVRDPA